MLTESDEDRKTVLNQALRNLEIELHEISTVRIEYVAEEGSSLVDSIERYVRYNGINFVIMGITGATKLEQVFIGSNALNMARQGICPVIIVPPNAKFKKIQNVMLLSDFKNVKSTTPVAQIKQILDSFKPNLHIVNVDSEHYIQLTEDYKRERDWMEKYSRITKPKFYFIRMYDFLDATSNFAADQNIDLIVTIPRKHSFLSGLYKTSHTKKLAYHSHIPVAAIHG